MSSTFSSRLRLELIGAGEQSGAWNNTTNTNLGTLIDEAIAGVAPITLSSTTYTLDESNGASDEARQAVLVFSGTPGGVAVITCPTVEKTYIIKNSTSGGNKITVKTAAGGSPVGVDIPNGSTAVVYTDGVDFFNAVKDLAASATVGGVAIATVSGAQTLTDKTLTAPKFADGGFIADANGNELIVLDTVTSAVNEITVANAATGSGPTISSTGSDSNIGLNLTPKGSGAVTVNGIQVISANDGTNAALRITQVGAGNALLVEDSANPDSTPFVVTADGNVGVGLANPSVQLQVVGTAQNRLWLGSAATTNRQLFVRSNGTFAVPTIVSSGDAVGSSNFFGYDGTANIELANITATVDGTPGTNDMPGRLTFSTTADGAASPTERFRIGSAGQLGVGGANYGTSGQVLTSGGASAAPTWSTLSASGVPDVIIQDQKSSGTSGGTATIGAWTTRTLNTLVYNRNTLAALASDQFTLPAGTYYISAAAPFYNNEGIMRIRLYNVTDASVVTLGRNAQAQAGDSPNRPNQIDAVLDTVVTITGSKAFRIEYYTANSETTSGLGIASSLGTEIYSQVKIWKL
jgi:hypothetical protein